MRFKELPYCGPAVSGLTYGEVTPLEGHTITRWPVEKSLRWVVDQRSRWRAAHYTFSCTCGWSGADVVYRRTNRAAEEHIRGVE